MGHKVYGITSWVAFSVITTLIFSLQYICYEYEVISQSAFNCELIFLSALFLYVTLFHFIVIQNQVDSLTIKKQFNPFAKKTKILYSDLIELRITLSSNIFLDTMSVTYRETPSLIVKKDVYNLFLIKSEAYKIEKELSSKARVVIFDWS